MIERVAVRRLAQRDLHEAQSWYRDVSPRLADDFTDAVEHAVALARAHPLAFPVTHRTFRRVVLHRFPYALFFYPDETRIVVVAVLHQSRDLEVLNDR